MYRLHVELIFRSIYLSKWHLRQRPGRGQNFRRHNKARENPRSFAPRTQEGGSAPPKCLNELCHSAGDPINQRNARRFVICNQDTDFKNPLGIFSNFLRFFSKEENFVVFAVGSFLEGLLFSVFLWIVRGSRCKIKMERDYPGSFSSFFFGRLGLAGLRFVVFAF